MIKFNKFNVTDGAKKARIFYSVGLHGGTRPGTVARPAVTLYARDFESGDALAAMFKESGGYSNYTDTMTDLFDEGSVSMYEEHPHYAAALARAKANDADRAAKKVAKLAPKPLPAAEIKSDRIVGEGAPAMRSLLAVSGGTEVAVAVGGVFSGCSVVVLNAAHKVWRGGGKSYISIDAALKNYKDPKVLAALNAVKSRIEAPAAEAVAPC